MNAGRIGFDPQGAHKLLTKQKEEIAMNIWVMNNEQVATSPKDFEELCDYVRNNSEECVYSIECDEPDYLCFYDIYGNKHEYISK